MVFLYMCTFIYNSPKQVFIVSQVSIVREDDRSFQELISTRVGQHKVSSKSTHLSWKDFHQQTNSSLLLLVYQDNILKRLILIWEIKTFLVM